MPFARVAARPLRHANIKDRSGFHRAGKRRKTRGRAAGWHGIRIDSSWSRKVEEALTDRNPFFGRSSVPNQGRDAPVESYAMIKIGVLSDTHIRHAWRETALWETLERGIFHDADMILHAGDMVDEAVLDFWGTRLVHAVRGNMDAGSRLPVRRVFEVGGFRFGLMHGWGAPADLEKRLLREFSEDALDCLVYGHTHVPACHHRNGLLLFNPGSATDPRSGPHPTVGLLEVGQEVCGRILNLDRAW